MNRYLFKNIQEDLKEKMVFLAGPRQVGKTTLALQMLKADSFKHPGYLSWDSVITRKQLLEGQLPADQKLMVFDEIHKYKDWRNLIKGFYDTHKLESKFLVTGSARLDFYRKGGDSLQGRYHFWRMHPLSLDEISGAPTKSDFEHLLNFGGFPEPFYSGQRRTWQRWQKHRSSRVFQEDLVSVEHVREVSQIEILASLLPGKICSPFSANAMREDLKCSHESVLRWLSILENLYVAFRIYPYSENVLRSLKKEPKVYLWDWSLAPSTGAKFENLVASHLLKYTQFKQDSEGEDWELRYIRDSEKRELDFVVLKDNIPQFAVECKSGEKNISSHIKYFASTTQIPIFYQVHSGEPDTEIKQHRARLIPFSKFVLLMSIQ